MVSAVCAALIGVTLWVKLTLSQTAESGCNDDTEVGEFCINHVSKQELTFADSKLECSRLGSILVLPLTSTDVIALANFVDHGDHGIIWVNLVDKQGLSNFSMQNGVSFSQEFFNNWWNHTSPEVSDVGGCVVMNKISGQFVTRRCDQKAHFACEIPKVICSSSFYPVGNMCLRTLTNTPQTFSAGRSACMALNGFLALPSNSLQQQLHGRYAKSRFSGTWLPGISRSGADYIRTHDGSKAIYLPTWAPGNPNYDGSCLNTYADGVSTESINDISCGRAFNYFCQANGIIKPNLPEIKDGTIMTTGVLSEVTCDENFYVKGNRRSEFGPWSAKWSNNFPPICTAKENPPRFFVKKFQGINPNKLLPFMRVAWQTFTSCPWLCHYEEKCVFAVFDKLSLECLVYDRQIYLSDVVKSDEFVTFYYGQ